MAEDNETLLLRLYVNGQNGRARQTVDRLHEILGEHADGRYELEVINIQENLEALERDQILATPTLVKDRPDPYTRLVGDLSDEAAVLGGINFI